jgi:DNA-binding transcriptional MerR regulator
MDEPKYYIASHAAKIIGIAPNSLRRYETIGVVSPMKDSFGRRLYTKADIDKIKKYREKL